MAESTFEPGSVTHWIAEMKAGDRRPTEALWDRYHARIVALARSRLGRATGRFAEDEEDIALKVFFDLFDGAPRQRFPLLDDRDDLWRILAVITTRKVIGCRRAEGRLKRGGGQVLGEADLDGDSAGDALEDQADSVTGAEVAAILAEEFDRRLGALGDDQIRRVALLRLDGYSNEEIAQQMDCAPRTVVRRVNAIRDIWREQAE